MALYFYQALSKEGKKINGYLDASSIEAVRGQLSLKGLFPVEIKLHKESSQGINFFSSLFEKPVAFKDLIMFTKQLGVLLKSGVPLMQALELLSDQFTGKLRSIIITLKDGIKEGKSLADGLDLYPKTFSKIYIQLIRAGEATGKLEVILERLTDYLERNEEITRKVSKALRQPLIQLVVIVIAVIIIMIKVIPNIANMLKATGKELPATTQFLISSSNLLTDHYLFILAMLLSIVVTFQYWISQPNGKRTMDKIKLKIPVIKYFARMTAITQFCSTLGMLMESGVNLSQALDIVCNIIDNSILVETLQTARDKIIKQGKITPFLKETGIFPPMAIYLINTGEQSGKLDTMLLTVAHNYETELSDLTENLTATLDPLMMAVMGIVVGFIMMAVMGPMLSMYDIA